MMMKSELQGVDIIQGFCSHVFRNKKGYKVYPNVFVGSWEADLLEISRYGLTYEYEVKVSRSDFLRDFKKTDSSGNYKMDEVSAGNRTNYFYYIVPRGLVAPDEVPDHAGLVYAYYGTLVEKGHSEKKMYFDIVKSAKKLTRSKADEKLISILHQSIYFRYHKLRNKEYLKRNLK